MKEWKFKFTWKTKGEELQLQEIVMDTQKQPHERMEVQKDLLEKHMIKYETLKLWKSITLEKMKQKWAMPKEFMIDTHNHQEWSWTEVRKKKVRINIHGKQVRYMNNMNKINITTMMVGYKTKF